MINASRYYKATKQQNLLEESHVDEIFELYKNRIEKKYVSKSVSTSDIEKEDWNLSVVRYIQSEPKESNVPINIASRRLSQAIESFQKSNEQLHQTIKQVGIAYVT